MDQETTNTALNLGMGAILLRFSQWAINVIQDRESRVMALEAKIEKMEEENSKRRAALEARIEELEGEISQLKAQNASQALKIYQLEQQNAMQSKRLAEFEGPK